LTFFRVVAVKPVPEKPDALPERMSNLVADVFEAVTMSPLWTPDMFSAFDPTKVWGRAPLALRRT
jgi:hypothetical protein